MPDDVIVDVAVGGRAARDEHNEDDAQHLCQYPSCKPRSVLKIEYSVWVDCVYPSSGNAVKQVTTGGLYNLCLLWLILQVATAWLLDFT